jgi:DNA polymerase-3 subunit gamma/tau
VDPEPAAAPPEASADPPAAVADTPATVELSLGAFEELWPAVLESLEAESPMLAAMLREARPVELAETGLTLAWPQSAAFSKRAAEDPAKRELIAQSIRAVTGASLRLAHELRADHEVAAEAAAPLSDDELVERFKREFGAVEEPTEES